MKNINLGFSTGVLHKYSSAKESVELIKKVGCKIVELGFGNIERINQGQLDEITVDDLASFEYVSLHAPKINYGNNKQTEKVLAKIERLNSQRKLDLVVIHPDIVSDFTIFKKVSFKVGFENMDTNKLSFHYPEELKRVISQDKKWRVVLDVNHIYTHDKSMKLASLFYDTFEDKIAEIHLSGFSTLHDPLYETKQIEIIKSISNYKTPIIIESVISPNTLVAERNYILGVLENWN